MIEWEQVAPMAVGIVLILTTGGVILLRPLSKRLAELLEVMARERSAPGSGAELERVREVLETVTARLALLEERQDFTDSLMRSPERRTLPAAATGEGAPRGPAVL